MELRQHLDYFARTEKNLHQLQTILDRALTMIPNGLEVIGSLEYEDLQRQWKAGIAQVTPVNGFSLTEALPAIETVDRGFVESSEIGAPPALQYFRN